jgi:hypothetical protein
MEIAFTTIVLGSLLFGDGLPSREEREYREFTMRTCAAAGITRSDLNARECTINEMKRKKADLLKDLRAGEWRRK